MMSGRAQSGACPGTLLLLLLLLLEEEDEVLCVGPGASKGLMRWQKQAVVADQVCVSPHWLTLVALDSLIRALYTKPERG